MDLDDVKLYSVAVGLASFWSIFGGMSGLNFVEALGRASVLGLNLYAVGFFLLKGLPYLQEVRERSDSSE